MTQYPVRVEQSVPQRESAPTEVVWDAAPPVAPPAPQEPSPFRRAHELLRGRYIWAVLLALVLAASGGYLTWRLQPALYQSSAVIRIIAYKPEILTPTPETGKLPMVDAFALWQAELIRSRRVQDLAMQSDDWRELGRGLTPQEEGRFRESLTVMRQDGAQLIHVMFTDEDPRAAQTGVNAVIDAYMRKYGEGDLEGESQRHRLREERLAAQARDVRGIRDQIMAIAREFGSDSLDQFYEFKIKQLHMLEEALKETRLSLTTLSPPASPGPDEDGAKSDEELTIEQIAVADGRMRSLLDQRRQIQNRLDEITPQHPKRVDVEQLLKKTQELIDDHAAAYRMVDAAARLNGGGQIPTLADLRAREQRLAEMYEQARTEALSLGRKKLQIDSLKKDLDLAEQRMEDTRSKIQAYEMETRLNGRVAVVSGGGLPSLPYNTGKRAQRAVLAGVGGGAMGVGLVLLIGLIDRRVRSSRDPVVEGGRLRLLGILPRMSTSLSDPDEAFDAANCVHHIRSMLQLNGLRNGRRVFTVTSPAQGTGKSSLTLAMGMSFAASRTRTLLIDGDLRGGHLSHRMRSITSRHVEKVLTNSGMISEGQADEALRRARETGQSFSDVLVGMGVVNEAGLHDALGFRENGGNGRDTGLAGALRGRPARECIAPTGVENLSVLPIGETPLSSISNVSPMMIRQMIEQVRDQYDVVLIDTGPLGGDCLTSMLAAEADGTVLIVSRGESRQLAERCLSILDNIGARLEGLVFNRARPHDFQTSAHSHSMSMVSKRVRPSGDSDREFRTVVQSEAGRKAQEFGPVAQAVACTSILPHGGFQDDRGRADGGDAHLRSPATAGGGNSVLPLVAAALILSVIAALAFIALRTPDATRNESTAGVHPGGAAEVVAPADDTDGSAATPRDASLPAESDHVRQTLPTASDQPRAKGAELDGE